MNIPIAVLADNANISQENKLNLMGIFTHIRTKRFPVIHPHMALVFVLEAEDQEERRNIIVNCMDDEDNKLIEVAAEVVVKAKHRINQIINIQQMSFEKKGDYRFNILIDGEHKRSVVLSIAVTN